MDGSRLVNRNMRSDEALTILFSTGKLNARFGPLQELRRRKGEAE